MAIIKMLEANKNGKSQRRSRTMWVWRGRMGAAVRGCWGGMDRTFRFELSPKLCTVSSWVSPQGAHVDASLVLPKAQPED